MRVAVLINTPPGNEFWEDVRQAWHDAFTTIAPHTQVNFYDPVYEAKFPNPRDYNLIVLSGGKADASSSEPWVLGVLDYVRNAARESPKTKILGICWGHQAVSRALGGEVQAVPTGPIVLNFSVPGIVLEVFLTMYHSIGSYTRHKIDGSRQELLSISPGNRVLCESSTEYSMNIVTDIKHRVPQFHVREVGKPAPGFINLAQNHECFVNEENTVLSFQGHPEIHSALARKMLLEEDDVYNGNSSEQQIQEELLKLEQPTDGTAILKRILEWVEE